MDFRIPTASEKENLKSRPVWKPVHLQPVFQVEGPKARKARNVKGQYRVRAVGGEVAEDLFNRGLCLPSGTAMTEEDLERIVSIIRKKYKEGKGKGVSRRQ